MTSSGATQCGRTQTLTNAAHHRGGRHVFILVRGKNAAVLVSFCSSRPSAKPFTFIFARVCCSPVRSKGVDCAKSAVKKGFA